MINELSEKAYETALKRGFYKDIEDKAPLVDVLNEMQEAVYAFRDRKFLDPKDRAFINPCLPFFKSKFEERVKDTFEDELADIMINVLSLAKHRGIDIEAHILAKMKYNEVR